MTEKIRLLKEIRKKIDEASIIGRAVPSKRPEMCRLSLELTKLALEVCGLDSETLESTWLIDDYVKKLRGKT